MANHDSMTTLIANLCEDDVNSAPSESGETTTVSAILPQIAATQDGEICGNEIIAIQDQLQPTSPILNVIYRQTELEVGQQSPLVTLGRHLDNHLIIDHPATSRRHARIEYRENQFFLIDQSAHGTYLLTADGERQLIQRQERRIDQKTWIGLGFAPTPTDPAVVTCSPRSEEQVRPMTVMFAEILGVARLSNQLASQKVAMLATDCLAWLASTVQDYHGVVLKTIHGKKIMVIFASPDDAAAAAIVMQAKIGEQSERLGARFGIRIGFHYGEVIDEGEDVFGDVVNSAARVLDCAAESEIVTTQETVVRFSPGHRERVIPLRALTVKGKKSQLTLCKLGWDDVEGTMSDKMLEGRHDPTQNPPSRIHLRLQDRTWEIQSNEPAFTMGREGYNQITIQDSQVSRTHARIEYQLGRFILVDQSTNGTYLVIDGHACRILRRDDAPLVGSGWIGLGREPNPASPLAIHFHLAQLTEP